MKKIFLISIHFLFLNSSFAQTWTQVSDFPLDATSGGFSYAYEDKGYWLAPLDHNSSQSDPGPYLLNYKLFEYDPVIDTWMELPNDDFPHTNLEMGDIYNEKIYFGYGQTDFSQDPVAVEDRIWSFDPADGTYTELSTCPGGGRFAGALLVHNDVIYSGSGWNYETDTDKYNDWWAYDLNTGEWTKKSDLPDSDIHRPISFVIGDFIYVIGSHEAYSWYKYDIINDTWSTINDQWGSRHVSGVQKYNGKVYVYGGDVDGHEQMPYDELFMEYDPVMDTWKKLPPIPSDTRRFGPGTFIIDDKLYVVSGGLNFIPEKTTWYFDMTQLETTSINGSLTVKELEVSPNPVSHYLTLNNIDLTRAYSLRISNLSGKQLYSSKLSNNKINLSSFVAGTYIINIYSDNEVYTQKVIKI